MPKRREPGTGEASTGAEEARQPSFFDGTLPLHLGHRQRLRERFKKGGADALPDYELLELVLFSAIPRRDTKDLAKRLIARFGSFSEVINAPEPRLKEVDGIGETRHRPSQALARHVAAHDEIRNHGRAPALVLGTGARLPQGRAGLRAARAVPHPVPRQRNRLIADEVQGQGTVDHTPVYVREVVKRALELASTAIILVHNHPSGDPAPSRADIDMTKQIVDAARPLNVTVHDHIIVGKSGHASLKALKLF